MQPKAGVHAGLTKPLRCCQQLDKVPQAKVHAYSLVSCYISTCSQHEIIKGRPCTSCVTFAASRRRGGADAAAAGPCADAAHQPGRAARPVRGGGRVRAAESWRGLGPPARRGHGHGSARRARPPGLCYTTGFCGRTVTRFGQNSRAVRINFAVGASCSRRSDHSAQCADSQKICFC